MTPMMIAYSRSQGHQPFVARNTRTSVVGVGERPTGGQESHPLPRGEVMRTTISGVAQHCSAGGAAAAKACSAPRP